MVIRPLASILNAVKVGIIFEFVNRFMNVRVAALITKYFFSNIFNLVKPGLVNKPWLNTD